MTRSHVLLVLGALVTSGLGAPGCGASATSSAGAADANASPPMCGLRQARQVDASCIDVGPADPPPASAAAFARSVDGWGITATRGERCGTGELSLLGQPSCAPVDECALPFPPPDAEVVVSTRSTDPRAVPTLDAALARVSTGGIIAVDAGTFGSSSVGRDVTIVGRCARDTLLGDGQHNALYVSGGHVIVRSATLSSASSPIAVSGGTVEAERVILTKAHVGVGLSGKNAKVTLRHSLIVGLGASQESMGAMVAMGASLTLEDTALREITTGVLSTDPGSIAALRRVVVDVLDGGPTSSGVEASAHGSVAIDESLIRSQGVRLLAAHDDVGTAPGAKASGGTIVVRSSVLEQVGVELTDNPAVAVASATSAIELTDVTLRHQALIGVLVGGGSLKMMRTAILGEAAVVKQRAAFAVLKGGTVDAESIAVPWAQGLALTVGDGASLDLRRSLLARVADRGYTGGMEAVLVSGGTAQLTDCELADHEREGIVVIGGGTVAALRTFVHGSHGVDASDVFGALALHGTLSVDGCIFEDDGEAIVAAGSSVTAHATAFRRHTIALRAMDGMSVLEDTTAATDNAIAVSACTFAGNGARTSLASLPELSASWDAAAAAGK